MKIGGPSGFVPELDSDEMSTSEFSFSSNESDESYVDLEKLRTFDIKILQESIETGSKILPHVTNKNVVLVIGKTGAGKSTFIQGIAGKKLHETVHVTECDGKTVEKSVFDAQDALPEFMIGHAKSSQTKAFCCFLPSKKDGKEEVVYIDTPGFEDTNHEEIDIATSVMLNHIAKKCKSLRFVVLINYTSLLEDRGGAARSILRFTRAFVRNFSQDREGFMFLFTHTNEISGLTDDLANSKRALLKEINRLKSDSDSSDKDLLSLLNFLKISLQKGYPFADVLHPLESNFMTLKSLIENRLKPIKSPTMVDGCGLTSTARNRLAGEINTIMLRSRQHLTSEPPNLQIVQENHELLKYLSSEINFSEVKNATVESTALINKFIQRCHRSIEDEITKGAVNDSMFSAAIANHVRAVLERLRILGAQQLSDHLFKKIGDAVCTCLESLQFDRGTIGHSHIRTLNKLSCWCDAFPEFIGHYTAVVEELKRAIAKTMEHINEFDCNSGVKPEALAGFLRSICFLNSAVQQMDLLVDLKIDFDGMTAAHSHALAISRQLLASLGKGGLVGEVALQEESLDKLSTEVGVLVAIQHSFRDEKELSDLAFIAGQLSNDLQGRVSSQFETLCQKVKKSSIDQLREPLQQLHAVLHRCHGIAGLDSCEMDRSFLSLIGIVEEKFTSASESLLRVAMPVESSECVLKGREAGLALNNFADHMWFDEFLPEGISIVAETYRTVYIANELCCQSIREEIVDHLDITRLKKISGNELQKACRFKSIATLKQAKVAYNRFLEIEKFAETTNNGTMLEDCNAVRAIIVVRAGRAMKAMQDLTTAPTVDFGEKKKTEATCVRLNSHLEEIDLLLLFTKDRACSERLELTREKLLATVQSLVVDVKSTFKSGADFDRMSKMLCVLSELDNGVNNFIFCQLPSLVDLKAQARHAVMKSFAKVQTLISETSNWEKIKGQMTLLNGALALDTWLDGDVAIQLKALQAFQEGKESRVDSRINEMIVAEDYAGIGELLSPLGTSRDQLKRKLFSHYIAQIEAALEKRSGKSLEFLPPGLPSKEITLTSVGDLDKLKEAKQELFKHTNPWLLPPEFRRLKDIIVNHGKHLKSQLNKKLRESLEQMEADLSDIRIGRLAADRKAVMAFIVVAKHHIFDHNIENFRKIQVRYDEILASPQNLVTRFFDSWFKDGKNLVTLLRSLQRASLADTPETADIAELYKKTREDLNDHLCDAILEIETAVSEHRCYGDGVSVLRSFQQCSDSGLEEHVDDKIIFKIEELIDRWHSVGSAMSMERKSEDKGVHTRTEIARKLDRLDPSTSSFLGINVKKWYCGEEYSLLKKYTETECRKIYTRGIAAMQSRNLVIVGECLQNLVQWNAAVCNHVKTIVTNIETLQNRVREVFLEVSEKLKSIVEGTSSLQCKSLFDEFRQIVVEVPSILQMDDCSRAFSLTNQLFCEKLEDEVCRVKDALKLKQSYKFLEIKDIVEDVRSFGDFMADYYVVLYEKVKHQACAVEDGYLKRIAETCHEHFKAGRDFGNIKHFIVLGLVPSASQKDVKRAYHLLMKRHHPDKAASKDSNTNEEKCRKLNEAWEVLNDEKKKRLSTDSEAKPFARWIRGLLDCLLEVVRKNLGNQQYEAVAQLLDQLYAVRELENLVSPPLDSKHIQDSVTSLVRGHVDRFRVSVKSNWSERKYKELQQDIDDLKSMEEHFKSHSAVFQASWNDGIIKSVESEVQTLGNEACLFLKSEQTAKERFDDFRRYFLRMGFVLVELPHFKEFTKDTMSSVLQHCLDEKWGYGYVFELGLSLRKGDDENPDEERVAQMLLSEFSHFKEVMTMVWNEETIRKPAEDTVQDIRGYTQNLSQPDLTEDIDIERDELLDHFRQFDAAYNMLLADFLPAVADINCLVRKTTKLAEQIKPLSCSKGWDSNVKKAIPHLLAGIFALFTVLKSGVAFNRLEASAETSREHGEKLLMKPHNIQVLTLLCMFGCGRLSRDGLDSQVMQIRTGEGKSMILGAAATLLGLLGFRVRCVCYSEDLSARDYGRFEDVFRKFQIDEHIVYSKITTLSEDTSGAKGDIRCLTKSLLLGKLPSFAQMSSTTTRYACARKELQETPVFQEIKSMEVNKSAEKGCEHPATGTEIGDQQPQTIEEQLETASSLSTPNPIVMATSERNILNKSGEQQLATAPGQSSAKPIVLESSKEEVQLQTREQQLKTAPHQSTSKPPNSERIVREEILLVDEVDVFFGQDFYGQTYNQVAQLREPEVAELLKIIWYHDSTQQKLRLSDLRSSEPYRSLLQKMNGFEYLLDNEISLMLKHVSRIDDEKPHFDEITQKIGYKVMDAISYDVTYGYRTVFAYLREYDRGNISDETLFENLTMPVSCGQFSYAEISPTRILGVSGTLDVMTRYEKEVLTRYGVNTYLDVPSVYGRSNFSFDQAGEGLAVETSKSDFYHKICEEIKKVTEEKRAVIVFFKDIGLSREFASSPFFKTLGRPKILSEDMVPSEKDFAISKAATAKQITICPAVFGRGTDFFCKDAKVEQNGGVHVIQTFLSEQRSEEVQIQGRTARQGKKGSYKLILLERDLEETFGIKSGEKDTIPKSGWYNWLCDARERYRDEHSKKVEMNLAAATKKDNNTHEYFDALLAAKKSRAESLFKEIYLAMKRPLPSTVILDVAFAVDTTGSMHRFSKDLPSMLIKLLQGQDCITAKLKVKFPELTFKLRVGVLGFRDIDDNSQQFEEKLWSDGSHFTEDMACMSSLIQAMASKSSGGHDLAEDTLGAIHRCAAWNQNGDWAGTMKCLLIATDAPAHGLAPNEFGNIKNGDSYSVRHPGGLTVESVVNDLMTKDIDLFFCSLNPGATGKTEQELANVYLNHPGNNDEKRVACIPLVQSNQSIGSLASAAATKHIVFILDESGSMSHEWSGVVKAYNQYVARRLQSQSTLDLVSVVQFGSTARLTVDCHPITSAPNNLGYRGGGTQFSPAASLGSQAAQKSPESHVPVVVFMSDGGTGDSAQAAQTLSQLNSIVLQRYNSDLELHVIAFGGGADTKQLSDIARASKIGRLHASANANALSQIFVSIAGGEDVTSMVESQIGKRISDTVASKLSAEYMG